MKTKIIVFVLLFFSFLLIYKTRAYALSWDIPRYNVEIEIEETSKFNVTEESTYIFNGELNGLRRDITLEDSNKTQSCIRNPALTCGGFEFLTFDSLFLDGIKQKQGEYKLYSINNESKKYFRIEKRLKDPAEFVVDEEYTWKLKYNIFGGIQWLYNKSNTKVPFFYWNLLPEDRGASVKNSTIKIKFPSSVTFVEDNLKIYSSSSHKHDYTYNAANNTLTIYLQNLPSFSYLTMSYEFSQNELISPGSIEYKFLNPTLGTEVYFDNLKINANSDNKLQFLPVGRYEMKFDNFGYSPQTFNLEVQPNKSEFFNVKLKPTPFLSLIIILNGFLTLLGIFGIVLAPIYVYQKWQKKGKDNHLVKTIVPKYKPPENIRPYLLGSIKDEKVDRHDITGSIIDLAYRGFLKIKELKKNQNYELTRLSGNKGEEVDSIEKDILDIIFENKDKITTKELAKTNLPIKLQFLITKIYEKMKTEKYFDFNPKIIRQTYFSLGLIILIIGLPLTVLVSVLITNLIGEYSFFTIGAALSVLGGGFILSSNSMPSKTKLGSKIFAEIKGFKMYLEAAERFRLQNLNPSEFEKYLSYAVVFGVEKKWAKSFKDVYKSTPEWYEGSGDLIDAIYISSFIRNFSNTAETSFINNSGDFASGSGWSGGGFGSGSSFGGFSGGGGGGGSSGGW